MVDSPGNLFVNDTSETRKQIKRLEPHQAYETLGVFLAPDGNLQEQFNKMLNVATIWADSMRTGRINKEEVWIALQLTIWCMLSYPLPALCLSRAQCEAIMAPVIRYCLPALGICQNYPRKLVFSMLDCMGIGIQHLFTMQEAARLKDLVIHTFNDTLPGQLYKSSLELLLIELRIGTEWRGIELPIIDSLATPSLIKATVLYTANYGITLKHDVSLLPRCMNNQLIMTPLLHLELSIPDLVAINHCRIFLKALFLSDIVLGDGTEIMAAAWNGEPAFTNNRADSWPRYGKPNRNSSIIWQQTLKKVFITGGRRLRHPLVAWLRQDDTWPWYTTSDGALFHLPDGKWFHHPIAVRRNRVPMYERQGVPSKKPNRIYRASVHPKRQRLWVTIAHCTDTSI
jgi:hypothetical protein